MTITTSYFSSKAPKERKVCIAKGYPRFLPGLAKAGMFAPDNPKATNWQEAFRANLEARFPTASFLKAYLDTVCETTPDPIFCCYEKDPADCHRSILAAYLKEKLGLDVREWQPEAGQEEAPKPRKKPAAPIAQLLLL